MSEPIMIFQVTIDPGAISEMKCARGAVSFIPFSATVSSPLFTGATVPGACDVQIENAAGSRHMCARYMFTGTDGEGNPCHLFVDNNGYISPETRNAPFTPACPSFLTDSPVLADYLCQQRFRTEVHGTESGVEIRVFDVLR